MKNVNYVAAILVAACAASIATNPAAAASKKHKPQQRQLSSIDAIKVTCLKQIGATVQGGYWTIQGGIGSAQAQAYYHCLDSSTMNKR
jgi:hypothetical protein